MKRKNRPRSSGLFLIELILAILFFSVASAVCVQIFVKSHLLSEESRVLNHAVNKCTSAAEYLSAMSGEELEEGIVNTYYDEEFAECKEDAAAYVMSIDTTEDNGLQKIHIEMRRADDTEGGAIYEMDTAKYQARRTSYEER